MNQTILKQKKKEHVNNILKPNSDDSYF